MGLLALAWKWTPGTEGCNREQWHKHSTLNHKTEPSPPHPSAFMAKPPPPTPTNELDEQKHRAKDEARNSTQ